MEQETSGSTGLLAAIVNSSFDAIISKTLEGTVTSWNPAATKLFGYDPGEMVGESIRRLIPVDRQDEEDKILARIKAGEQVESYETVRVHKNGHPIDVFLTSSPIWGPDGTIIGASKIVRDITEKKKAAETLRKREEVLRQFVEQACAALAMFDRDMRYMACSRRWLTDHGLEEQDIVGRSHYEVFPDVPDRWKEAHRRGMAGEILGAEEDAFVRADGRTQWMRWGVRPWLTGDGSVGGIMIMAEDVTKRVEAVQALRESELRMRLAQEAAKAGTWEWCLADNRSKWSENTWNLYGLNPEQCVPSFEAWASSIHPEDREQAKTALKQAASIGGEYEVQWRVNLPEGEPERWLLSRGRQMGATGEPERYMGVVIDITERKRMEAALRESEERLKFVLEAANAGTWEELETGEIASSDLALSFLGFAPGTALTHDIALARVHPDDRSSLKEGLRHTLETGEPYRLEWRSLLPDGSMRWLETRGERRFVSGKHVIGGLVQDITERKHAEEALRESEQRLRFALETANAGTWEAVPETGEFTPSERALAIHGAPPWMPMSFEKVLEAVHPEDRERAREAAFHVLGTKRVEFRIPLPDGSIRWLESWGEPRFVLGRQVVSGLLQDITERKRAEQALREREELLHSIIEHAPNPMILWREDRKVLLMNPALMELSGYTAFDIPTRDEWEMLAYREKAPRGKEDFDRTFESSSPAYIGDQWVYTKSGEKRLWSLTRAPAGRDALGRRLIVGVALDITERRKSEEEALATKSKLEAALAAMRDAVFISDSEGRLIHLNEAFATFHKFKSRDDCAKTLAEYPQLLDVFLPNGELAPLDQWALPRALRGEIVTQAEYALHRKDTGDLWVGSYNFAPIRSDDGEIIGAVATARDVTEQKANERRLRESEARLSSIIDTAADCIVVIDEKGIIQSANRATESIFGYGLEDLIGRNIAMLMAPNLAAQHDRYLKGFSGKGGIRQIEGRRKDGSMIPIDVAVAAWRDGEGRRFFTGILRDLTERKRNEEALANARRLEAVGQLAGGVAHDFNNLLHVISGNLEIAEDLIGDETARDFLERARSAAEKGSALNGRLLSLARKRALKLERLDLNDRVQETAKLLASTVGEHISVTTDRATGLWMTLADPGEIDSAILNLAANARDAMPGGGNIQISTSNVTLDAAAAKLHREAAAGDYVRLAIADNGVGMPEDILDKATEAFFTTKGPGAGTGLGLTSVASFASQMGGFMSIESALGNGCTVSIYLPRTTKGSAARGTLPSGSPHGRGQLILVVEDDDEVREVTLKRLETLGYTVTEARTGPEALERLTLQEGVRLVLSDVVMPGGMTGYDVARWVASNKPDVKVIMCSGYNERERAIDAQQEGVTTLGKPYTRDQLAGALSNAFAP